MKRKLLRACRALWKNHPFTFISLLVMSVGGAPLLLYAVGAGELPDFSLSDLTGTLIATFVIEVTVAPLLALYSLFAGFGARLILDKFYPDAHGVPPGHMGPPTRDQHARNGLVRGPFILFATALSMLLWIELLASPFVQWQSPALIWLTVIAYLATYSSLIWLLLGDRSRRGATLSKVLWSALSFGVSVITLLYAASHREAAPLDSHPNGAAHPIVYLLTNVEPLWSAFARWIVALPPLARIAVATLALLLALPQRWLRKWPMTRRVLALGNLLDVARRLPMNCMHAVAIAVLAIVTLPWAMAACEWIKGRFSGASLPWAIAILGLFVTGLFWIPWAQVHDVLSRQSSDSAGARRDMAKLMAAKIAVAIGFAFLSGWVMLFASVFLGSANSEARTQTVFLAGAVLIVFNWGAFAIRGWRERVILCLGTAVVLFMSIPMTMQNPLMFPRMIVGVLGFGNRHASSMAVSAQQCATLAPYGVRCAGDKDGAITLTDVNIVNRLGSSMSIELVLRTEGNDSKPISKGPSAGRPSPSAIPQSLVLTDAAGGTRPRNRMYECDRLLMGLRLHAAGRPHDDGRVPGAAGLAPVAMPPDLACVQVTIPKDQVISYTKSGPRTYEMGYSGYLAAPDKAEKAP